jgi:release factor glutamine methyltransferase
VDPSELKDLSPEVRDHEPRAALVAPDPPYGIYGRLAAQAAVFLRPGGHALVEVGQGMADAVAERFRAAGMAVDGMRPDLAGIPRVVAARRP